MTRLTFRTLVAMALLLAPALAASAQTVTVTTAADVIDITSSGTIDDLPGPDGVVSFSEAMIATNNTPGHQTVAFAIPPDEWILQFLFPGRAVLTSITGFYFRSFDEVTIDGSTQTAFTGDTNPDGCEVVIYGDELYLNGDNSTLVGFDSTAVTVTGSNGLVEGNTGTMNITLFDGGGTLIRNNTGGTIKIDRSSDNIVVGNTVQRVRVLGFSAAQPAANNRIGGPDPADRNFITGYGYVNGEGLPGGTTVQLFATAGTLVENNWIGTTPDGLASGSAASTVGVGFEGDNRDATIRGNRIAGILGLGQNPHHAGELYGWAVMVRGTGDNITIVGNTIGLDANDQPALGSVWGIDVGDAFNADISNIRIGGTQPGEGNTIAGHILNGITVGEGVVAARLSGNSIFDNGWIGIDLIPTTFGYGVTPNDPLDADSGGNGLQNFPVIAAATRQGPDLHVVGTLHSAPSSAYTIEFFASAACDETGFGEGQVFLGVASVSTDAAGDGAFDVLLPASVALGWQVSATATREPIGATSEFASCVTVDGEVVTGDLDGDGLVGINDLLMLLAAWGPCGTCPADLDNDGVVNIADLLMLLGNWSA